jgi:hypothetical protein
MSSSSSGRTSNESSQFLRSKSASNIKPSIPYTRKTPEQLQTNIVENSQKLYDDIQPIIEKTGELVYQLKSNDATLKSLFDKYTQKINKINKENNKIHETLIQNHLMIHQIPAKFNQMVLSSGSFFRQVSSARRQKSKDNQWVLTNIESPKKGGRTRKHKSRRHNKRRRSNRRSRRLL